MPHRKIEKEREGGGEWGGGMLNHISASKPSLLNIIQYSLGPPHNIVRRSI